MNNNQSAPPMPQTLTQFCDVDDTAFDAYLKQKDVFLEQLDNKAEARIADCLQQRLSWVA